MLQKYLNKLGFTARECEIYISLAEVGAQPASVIAKRLGQERVTVYKDLKALSERGFVKIYSENGIQTFGIDSFEHLQTFCKDQAAQYQDLSQEFETAENVLKGLEKSRKAVPRLEIFEGENGIKNLFKNMLFEMKQENVRQIRLIASNTFEERLGDVPLSKFIGTFFKELKLRNVDVEVFEATGNLMPEELLKVSFKDLNPDKLPAARGTTNLFLVGHCLYIACYKDGPIGLKVKHAEMSQMFHFLMDVLGKRVNGN